MVNTGKKLEDYAQYVYSRLLELNDYENTLVSTKVTIKGQSGATNEFDVYYQFTHLNIDCRVAIECKDWENRVSIKEIRDFSTKLHDVGMGNMIGVMISQVGYQDGTQKFAESNGIKLMTVDDLPSIVDIVSGALKKGFLPDEKVQGEPFWTIMEVDKGETTGSYLTVPYNRPAIPLFYSKNMANFFLNNSVSDKEKYQVRGLSKYQLKVLLNLRDIGNLCFAIFVMPFSISDLQNYQIAFVEAEDVENDYI